MKNRIKMASLLTVLSLLVFLSLLVLFSGCVKPEAKNSIQDNMPASTPTPKSNLKIGEIVELPGMEAAITEANKTDHIFYSYGGKNITEMVDRGEIFIVADFWIRNTGNKTIRFTNTPFALRDNAGFKYYPMLYSGYYGVGLLNDSYPGQTKRGEEVFRVPAEAHGFNFYLDTNSFTGPDFASLPIKVESISWWPGR